MPLEFVTNSFLPSEMSARSDRRPTLGRKTLLPESKTDWQQSGQDSAVNQHVFACLVFRLEGMFYLMAFLLLKGMPRRAFFV
jgi:hypothetical protein